MTARVDEDDCCCAIGDGDGKRMGLASPSLGDDNAVAVRIGVCHMMRSNGSIAVLEEDGVLGASPAGAKV